MINIDIWFCVVSTLENCVILTYLLRIGTRVHKIKYLDIPCARLDKILMIHVLSFETTLWPLNWDNPFLENKIMKGLMFYFLSNVSTFYRYLIDHLISYRDGLIIDLWRQGCNPKFWNSVSSLIIKTSSQITKFILDLTKCDFNKAFVFIILKIFSRYLGNSQNMGQFNS